PNPFSVTFMQLIQVQSKAISSSIITLHLSHSIFYCVACCSPRRGVQSFEQLPCRDRVSYTALFYFTDRCFARVSNILRAYVTPTRCLASVFSLGRTSYYVHMGHNCTVLKARSALTT